MKKSQERFYMRMTEASEKVKYGNKLQMDKTDIIHGEDDEEGKFFANTFFDENKGLVSYFNKHSEDFANNGGEDALRMGDKKFFYKLAYRWYEIDKKNLMPNTNEMRQDPFFEYVAKGDEQLYPRIWADVDKFSKVGDQLVNLDSILQNAALTGKIDEIMKLHGSIQTLEGSLGVVNVNKFNYIIANAVTRFFQEDYRNRFPFPFNMVTGLFAGGRNSALSTIHYGSGSMTWKEEEIRDYAHQLFQKGYLQEKGKWSAHMLELAVGADTLKYGLSSATSISFIIFMVTLTTLIKKAMEDEAKLDGKKGH
jgi:hypothetical protein